MRCQLSMCLCRYGFLHHWQLQNIPIKDLLAPSGIVAVWITNRPKFIEYVRASLFNLWGLDEIGMWHWVKVCDCGSMQYCWCRRDSIFLHTSLCSNQKQNVFHNRFIILQIIVPVSCKPHVRMTTFCSPCHNLYIEDCPLGVSYIASFPVLYELYIVFSRLCS